MVIFKIKQEVAYEVLFMYYSHALVIALCLGEPSSYELDNRY